MTAKDIKVGEWFMTMNHKWYKKIYQGTNRIKATQVGTAKVYLIQNDEEVKPQSKTI